jgi:hypothetical protein
MCPVYPEYVRYLRVSRMCPVVYVYVQNVSCISRICPVVYVSRMCCVVCVRPECVLYIQNMSSSICLSRMRPVYPEYALQFLRSRLQFRFDILEIDYMILCLCRI